MTSMTDSSENDLSLQTIRRTVSIDEVTDKIIENLIGVKGKSKSAVIFQIIKDWIDDYSEVMRKNWDINFGSIRRQVMLKYQGEPEKGTLSEEAKTILRKLPEMFKTIESIEAIEVAELLDIDVKKLRNIILMNSRELQAMGLKLSYNDGKFIPIR